MYVQTMTTEHREYVSRTIFVGGVIASRHTSLTHGGTCYVVTTLCNEHLYSSGPRDTIDAAVAQLRTYLRDGHYAR